MFPKLIVPLRPGIISSTAWANLTWVYTGVGSGYDLNIDAAVTITDIFAPQLLTLQLYLSVPGGWVDIWTQTESSNGTVSVIDPAIFFSLNSGFYTKGRFILNLGGQYSEPGSEVNIPYP